MNVMKIVHKNLISEEVGFRKEKNLIEPECPLEWEDPPYSMFEVFLLKTVLD